MRLDPSDFDPGLDHLAVTLSGGVATVTLSDPERRNAMGTHMTAAWGRFVQAVAADVRVRVIVVRGAGTAFSSGGDTNWIGAAADLGEPAVQARMHEYYLSWLAIRTVPQPVIAAINGPAVGAAAALALACDLRWASDAAMMSFPFVHLGIHAGMGSTWLLRQVVGTSVAADLLLSGRPVSGAELRELGLVSHTIASAEFELKVEQQAAALAAAAPLAVASLVATLRTPAAATLAQALAAEAAAQAATFASDDVREALAARREGRPAVFQGR